MRRLLALGLALASVSCVPIDVGGCPVDPATSVGTPCANEGSQCGEASLCDPCLGDTSECDLVECRGGTWQPYEWPPGSCDGGG